MRVIEFKVRKLAYNYRKTTGGIILLYQIRFNFCLCVLAGSSYTRGNGRILQFSKCGSVLDFQIC